MLLSEFDSNKKAIINPEDLIDPISDFPETVVSCFARETFKRILDSLDYEELARTSMANIEIPIYRVIIDGRPLALYNSPVGASACVAIAEDLWAMGARKFLLFGTCGVLDEKIADTSVIVPLMALRDEGTSFHYAELSDEITLPTKTQQSLIDFLEEKGISYRQGKVWTTDGIYRETADKMAQRKAAGAICVDMECAAMTAWADFRGVEFCQFFYAADHLSEENWNPRSLANTANLEEKDKIASLALEVALRL